MTIDEAIERYKAITNTNSICPMPCMSYCEKCVEESTQLLVWLEELKEYKKKPEGCMWNEAERKGYNKAIDDFIHECDKYCGFYRGDNKNKNITRKAMLSIAEQLKEGGNNERL